MNAFQGVRQVREAWVDWELLPADTRRLVIAAMPEPVRNDTTVTGDDWGVGVVLLRKDGEDLRTAAERVALYVTLHQERYRVTPSLYRILIAAQNT